VCPRIIKKFPFIVPNLLLYQVRAVTDTGNNIITPLHAALGRFFFTFIFLVFSVSSQGRLLAYKTGSNQSQATASEIKRVADVSVLIDDIHHIDISEREFKITAEVAVRWAAIEPPSNKHDASERIVFTGLALQNKLNSIWHPEFVVTNSIDRRHKHYQTLVLFPDNHYELFEQFDTTLVLDSVMKTYPFGTLDLMLEISSFTHPVNEMLLTSSAFSVGHPGKTDSTIHGNWNIESSFSKLTTQSSLNYGGSEFTHIEYHIKVRHDFLDTLLKIFFPMIAIISISMGIISLSSLRHVANINWHMGGHTTLILTIFAIRFALSDSIPTTHYLNLVDALFMITTIIVWLNLLGSLLINSFFRNELITTGQLLERRRTLLSPVLLVILFCGLVWYSLT
jgi:hypothetical protein